MNKLMGKASGQQLAFGEFSKGSMVMLDGGKRMRLDDKVDFWPATGAWKVLATGEDGNGPTAMFAFLAREREKAGDPVPDPAPVPTSRRISCNYCEKPAELHWGEAVYPHRKELHKKKFWVCWGCDAWVGCHEREDGAEPLGTLAKEDLRDARIKAHDAFDSLWRHGEMSREEAYSWLAQALGIPPFKCHISRMDLDYVRRVVDAVDERRERS